MAIKITFDDGTVCEGTPEEIAELNGLTKGVGTFNGVNNEADKTEDADDKQRPVVGDKVKLTIRSEYYWIHKDSIFTVEEDDNLAIPFLIRDTKYSWIDFWVKEEEIEVIENGNGNGNETPLKPRDYAKVVPHDNSNFFGVNFGDIVTIKSFTDGQYEVRELNGGDYNDNPYAIREALVKATDEEVMKALEPEFTEGDKAITLEDASYSVIKKGELVKIDSYEIDDDGELRFFGLNTDDSGWLAPRYLRKVEGTEEEMKWAEIGRKVDEYREGDIVMVVEDNAHFSRNKKGDIGYVKEVHMSGAHVQVISRNTFRANGNSQAFESIKLITPVEKRFDHQ